jgi:hypothetical protein
MLISIVNHTNGRISDEAIHPVVRAINRQIAEDFAPNWGMSATLRLEGRSAGRPDRVQMADLRGDAIIYLWNQTDVDDAVGYHFQNARGIPFGFVFSEIAEEIGEPWSVTLSHEALELVGDPETNLLVMGPHPTAERDVFHWLEMCDAVQAETYKIDGVDVSNFVLPLYFTGTRDTDEVGARNDFLGRSYDGVTLQSFGINPGGYIGFFDPKTKDHETFAIEGDAKAAMRLQTKAKAKEARRAVRYRTFDNRERIMLAESRAASTKAAAPREAVADDGHVVSLAAPATSKRRVYVQVSATNESPVLQDKSPTARKTRRPSKKKSSQRSRK